MRSLLPFFSVFSVFVLNAVARSESVLAPAPSIEVVDRHGRLLRSALPEDLYSVPVPLSSMSPFVVLTTLAAEDRRFFDHHGVDPRAVARAIVQNLSAGRTVSGGSTITQQLSRALTPRPKSLWGKLGEAWRALKLERSATKDEILEAYLNRAPYGRGTRGVEAASRAWFGASSRDLTLGQAALLAGLPKCPSRCDPQKDPKAAEARRKVVLGRMASWGWISETERAAALAERISVADRSREDLAPHFARRALSRGTGARRETTLDADLQRELEELTATHLKSLASHHATNAAVVVLDNADGSVLAWVGSGDFRDEATSGQVDGAAARRQPGSALKPFLYGLAFERGASPSDLIDDAPTFAVGGFAPRNYDETFHGAVSLRQALACSYNAPAVRVAERVGVGAFLTELRAFGFDSLDLPAERYGAGLALGNGEVTLRELAGAYAALARGGVRLPVRETMDAPKGPASRVLSREAAYLVTSVLSDDDARVPAFGHDSALRLPFPFAAKTGTTKDYKDNWAAGYTPDWTVAVWVGNFDGKPMRRVSGVTGAAPLLRDATLAMEKRYGARPFPVPAGVREAEICPLSGRLAGARCPGAVRAVFRRDKVPSETCALEHAEASAPEAPSGPRISFPRPGDAFRVDPATPLAAQAIPVSAEPEDAGWRWLVDGKDAKIAGARGFLPLAPGVHVLRAVAPGVAAEPVSFRVLP